MTTEEQSSASDGFVLDGFGFVGSLFFVEDAVAALVTLDCIVDAKASLLAAF